MPTYLFKPLTCQHAKLNFKAVNALAEAFKTSQTATAIRLFESDHAPALLVCAGPRRRKWFTRAPSVPQRWFPQDALDSDNFAFDVLFGGELHDPMPPRIVADAWFERQEAERFEIGEQTCRTGPDEVLTLILVSDPDTVGDQGDGRL